MSQGIDASGHPISFESFFKEYPSFVWGPLLFAGVLFGGTRLPVVQDYLSSAGMEAFGPLAALHYTAFAVILSYAVHGWVVTHASVKNKIQSGKEYQVSPQAMAIRSTATILTSMVYSFLPLAPNSTSIKEFVAWTFALAIYWDLHFYVAHRYAHENKRAYTFFHKLHHLCKQPNCFGAYFVTYQSHILLEQIVVCLAAAAGLPKDVFVFSLYWGTLGTLIEHCGYEVGQIQLPFIPISFGTLCSVIGFPGLVLDGK
jgi:hypothetical protein